MNKVEWVSIGGISVSLAAKSRQVNTTIYALRDSNTVIDGDLGRVVNELKEATREELYTENFLILKGSGDQVSIKKKNDKVIVEVPQGTDLIILSSFLGEVKEKE